MYTRRARFGRSLSATRLTLRSNLGPPEEKGAFDRNRWYPAASSFDINVLEGLNMAVRSRLSNQLAA